MKAGFGVHLQQVIQVVTGDGLLQLGVDLLRVRAVSLDEFLLLVLGLDVGLAFVPGKKRRGLGIKWENIFMVMDVSRIGRVRSEKITVKCGFGGKVFVRKNNF